MCFSISHNSQVPGDNIVGVGGSSSCVNQGGIVGYCIGQGNAGCLAPGIGDCDNIGDGCVNRHFCGGGFGNMEYGGDGSCYRSNPREIDPAGSANCIGFINNRAVCSRVKGKNQVVFII